MAHLTARQRRSLPRSDYAIPERAPGPGSYPIPDESHARDALARSAGKPEHGRVVAAAKRRYPDMEVEG